MKRVAFVAALFALALSLSASRSVARTGTQSGNELLNSLPDGNGVALIDVQRVTSSPLWNMLAAQEKFHSAFDKMQSELSEVGVNLSDLQTVAVGFTAPGGSDPCVIVSGRLNQSALIAHLRGDAKVKLTSETYKGTEVFKVEHVETTAPPAGKHHGNDAASFAFYDAGTAVVGSAASVHASIDVKGGTRASLAQNAKLTEALAASGNAAVRFALEVTPSLSNSLPTAKMGDFSSIKLIFGGVDVTTGVELTATLRSDTADHARGIATQLTGLLDMVRGMVGASNDAKLTPIATALKTVTIAASDVDVHITGNVPMEVLAQLLK